MSRLRGVNEELSPKADRLRRNLERSQKRTRWQRLKVWGRRTGPTDRDVERTCLRMIMLGMLLYALKEWGVW